MHLKTSDPGKLLLNQEPIGEWSPLGYWRKLQLFEDWKNSCHQARSRKNSWLRWILGGHRNEKCLASWSFGARKSNLGVQPCNHAEGDLLETPVPCVYSNTSVTIPPTRQLSYQICPEESACRFRESSSRPRMVRKIFNRPVQIVLTDRGAGRAKSVKVIKVMHQEGDVVVSLTCEDVWSWPDAERQDHIDIKGTTPFHTQQLAIFCMDWHNTVCILHIKFHQKGTRPCCIMSAIMSCTFMYCIE